MIFLVDHDDSFTNNIASCLKVYLKNDLKTIHHSKLNQLKSVQDIGAVIYSPGPGHPSQYQNSIDFYKGMSPKIPFLGICLGHQLLLYAHGAEIKQIAKRPGHGRQVHIHRQSFSRLLPKDAIQGTFVLYNSLGCFKSDGVFNSTFRNLCSYGQVSLACEHASLPHIGVQFHPESFASTGGATFLKCYVDYIKEYCSLNKGRAE